MHSDQNRRVTYGLFVQRQQASRRASDEPRTASYRHLLLERHADELDRLHLDGWVTRDPAHQLFHIGNLGTRVQEREREIDRASIRANVRYAEIGITHPSPNVWLCMRLVVDRTIEYRHHDLARLVVVVRRNTRLE